jgi:hypothetical protein
VASAGRLIQSADVGPHFGHSSDSSCGVSGAVEVAVEWQQQPFGSAKQASFFAEVRTSSFSWVLPISFPCSVQRGGTGEPENPKPPWRRASASSSLLVGACCG